MTLRYSNRPPEGGRENEQSKTPRLRTKHDQADKSAETETIKLIRQTRQATTKRYSAEDKICLVMEGIRGELPIRALCRREGIHANLCY